MAFSPLMLLQQLTGQVPAPEENIGSEIIVQAPQERPTAERMRYEEAPARSAVTPRYVLNDDRIAPNKEELQEILPRQGMFGVKGTLRDVLGTLGDAFLTQAGRDSVYRPQRLREQMGDAMYGAAYDPLQAAERLAAAGFTEQAQELIQEYNRNNYQQGMLASTEGARADQAWNRQRDDTRLARNQVARWMQAAKGSEARLQFVRSQAARLADELGIDPSQLLPADDLTLDQQEVLAAGDMTVNQQQTLPLAQERVSQGQQNADSYEYSVRNRNPPPRPRADSDTETALRIGDIPPEDRTPGQENWLREYNERNGSNRGSRIPSVAPPPSNARPNRFRIIR